MTEENALKKSSGQSVEQNVDTSYDNRITWVDFVKTFACVLVVLGHFLQSMVKSGILNDSVCYEVFNTVIYYFNNPLLFICSGFLYQMRYKEDKDVKGRINYKVNRVYNLIIPYLFFVTVTWAEKKIMANYVNTSVEGYLDTIITASIAPYWFLTALMLMYVLVPQIRKSHTVYFIIYIIAAIFVNTALKNYIIWFPLIKFVEYVSFFIVGMMLKNIKNMRGKQLRNIGLFFIALFCMGFVGIYYNGIVLSSTGFIFLALTGSIGIVILAISYFQQGIRRTKWWETLSEYTFPVFMMHTLAAAPIRIVLNFFHISQAWVHILFGLGASFFLPVIVYIIMKKMEWPLFVLYPSKVVKEGRKN